MRFDLVDRVLETGPDRIVTLKQVTAAEEYLQDHFATFPILPGVFMLEAMVQAGRRLLEERAGARLVLGEVRAVKYGAMVKPGSSLRVEIELLKEDGQGGFNCKGKGLVSDPQSEDADAVAVSGKFSLRPVRLGP